jgi:hypothetical protein
LTDNHVWASDARTRVRKNHADDTSGITEGSVRFTLDDGETMIVPDHELRPLYESLWEISREPGAISTAALVMDASRMSDYARSAVELTTPQSVVLRKAVSQLHV